MKRMQYHSLVYLILLIFPASLFSQNSPVLTIKDLQEHKTKSLYVNRTVTVSGTVSYPNGLINLLVFYIQANGYGIRCYGANHDFTIGDSVTVSGKVIEYNGETELLMTNADFYKLHGNRQLVQPVTRTLKEIQTTEELEGTLVRVFGTVENRSLLNFSIREKDTSIKIFFAPNLMELPGDIEVGDIVSATGTVSTDENEDRVIDVRFQEEFFKSDSARSVPLNYAFEDKNYNFYPDFEGEEFNFKVTVLATIQLPGGGSLIHFSDATRGAVVFSTDNNVNLTKGDYISLSGNIGLRSGFEQVNNQKITVIKKGNPIFKSDFKIRDILGEKNQGQYVTVSGNVRKIETSKYETFFKVADATGEIEVYLPAHLNMQVGQLNLEDNQFITVSGIANQYDNSPPYNENYQLKIVDLKDIVNTQSNINDIYKNILIILSIAGLIIAFSAIIIFWLRKQIQLKTAELELKAKYLEFETQMTKGLNRRLHVDEILSFISGSILSIIKFDTICFGILDKSGNFIQLKTLEKKADKFVITSHALCSSSEMFVDRILKAGEPFFTTTGQNQISYIPIDTKNSNLLCYPVKDGEQSIAIVIIASENEFESKQPVLDPLNRFSNHIAIGLKNASLVEELQQAYQEVKDAQNQLVQNEKMKAIGQLASGMAHDFNNILSVIMGMTQFLLKTETNEDSRKKLNSIIKASTDGATIISRIQEFSRVKAASEWQSLDINEILNDVIALTYSSIKQKKEIDGIQISIETHFDPNLFVLGNQSELRTAFTNILFNSMDATVKSGIISITTWSDSDSVFISLEDNGIGMTEETKQKIFEPFFSTKGTKGNGLGMSQVYGIVKRHHGDIEVESELNKGTKITIKLIPSFQNESQEEVAEKLNPEAEKTKLNAGKEIMVVEDEPEIRNIMKSILQSQGYNPHCFESAESAIASFKPDAFNLLITDLGLSGLNGWELIRSIRKADRLIPILIVTGWGNEINQDKLKEHSVNALIAKPFKIDQILGTVEDLLNKARS